MGLGSWGALVSTWEGGARVWSRAWCAGVGDGAGGPLPLPECVGPEDVTCALPSPPPVGDPVIYLLVFMAQ